VVSGIFKVNCHFLLDQLWLLKGPFTLVDVDTRVFAEKLLQLCA